MSHVVSKMQIPHQSETRKSRESLTDTRLQAAAKSSKNNAFSNNFSSELKKRDPIALQKEASRTDNARAKNKANHRTNNNSTNNNSNATNDVKRSVKNNPADSSERLNKHGPPTAGPLTNSRDSEASNETTAGKRGNALPLDANAAGAVTSEDGADTIESVQGDARLTATNSSLPGSLLPQPLLTDAVGFNEWDGTGTSSRGLGPSLLLSDGALAANSLNTGAANSRLSQEAGTSPQAGVSQTSAGLYNSTGLHSTGLHNNGAAASALSQSPSLLGIAAHSGIQAINGGANHARVGGIQNNSSIAASKTSTQVLQGSLPPGALSMLGATDSGSHESAVSRFSNPSANLSLSGGQGGYLTDYLTPQTGAAQGQLFGAAYLDRLGVTNPNAQASNMTVIPETVSPLLTNSGAPHSLESETDALKSVALAARPQGSSVSQFAAPNFTIASQLTNPAWGQDVGQRIYWMVKQNVQHAELQLNPRHLGPMDVKVSVGQDQQVNVSFITQHSGVKDALDTAIPRLREMLDNQGLNLGSVNVSDQASRQQQEQPDNNERDGRDVPWLSEAEVPAESTPQTVSDYLSNGFVDLYA